MYPSPGDLPNRLSNQLRSPTLQADSLPAEPQEKPLIYNVCVCAQSCPTLCKSMDCSPPDPTSMGFPRQEYWSGLPFSSPGDLPDSGIEHASPALAGGFFTTEPPGKPKV